MGGPVYVQQPEPGGLEPAGGQVGETAHEVEAEPGVVFAFRAQGIAVQRDRPDRLDRPPVELPDVRVQQPGEPGHLPGARVWTMNVPPGHVAMSSATLPSRSR